MNVQQLLEDCARIGVTLASEPEHGALELGGLEDIDDIEQTPEERYRELACIAEELLDALDTGPFSFDLYRDSGISGALQVLVFGPNQNRMSASVKLDLDRLDETQLEVALQSILTKAQRELGDGYTRYAELLRDFGGDREPWDMVQALADQYAEYRQLVDVERMTPREAFDRVQRRLANRQRRGPLAPAQLLALVERTLQDELSDDSDWRIELVSVLNAKAIFHIIEPSSGTGRVFAAHLDDDAEDIGPEFDFACSELRAYIEISEMLRK